MFQLVILIVVVVIYSQEKEGEIMILLTMTIRRPPEKLCMKMMNIIVSTIMIMMNITKMRIMK